MIKVSKVASNKNVTFHINGVAVGPDIACVEAFKGLKFSSALWIIQEKLIVLFGWDRQTVLFPMESRNSVRFDVPVLPPAEWDGTFYLRLINWDKPDDREKYFLIVLDFDR